METVKKGSENNHGAHIVPLSPPDTAPSVHSLQFKIQKNNVEAVEVFPVSSLVLYAVLIRESIPSVDFVPPFCYLMFISILYCH